MVRGGEVVPRIVEEERARVTLLLAVLAMAFTQPTGWKLCWPPTKPTGHFPTWAHPWHLTIIIPIL